MTPIDTEFSASNYAEELRWTIRELWFQDEYYDTYDEQWGNDEYAEIAASFLPHVGHLTTLPESDSPAF